jgi:biopolymer transport protein ExbB
MNNRILLPILFFVMTVFSAKPVPVDERVNEIAKLKNALLSARDSLQRDIAMRWRDRQRAVEQREIDKEELAVYTERQEKTFNALLAAKEEIFSFERRLETARKELDDKKQESRFITSTLNEMLDKEAQQLSGFFPLDIDSSRMRFELLRRDFAKKNNSVATIRALADYYVASLENGHSLELVKTTVLPDGEGALPMTVARFGTVFAYGMTEEGKVFTIGQSGREDADRYRIRRVDNPVLLQQITDEFTQWTATGRPQGNITVDIMQSDLSGEMITGKGETRYERAKKFFIAGGPVMIPLAILPLWALILILLKLAQFIGRRGFARRAFTGIAAIVDKSGIDEARVFTGKRRGYAARTAAACLDNKVTTRKGAESAVAEVLSRETSRLGSHLNTLAVIAAVAPLLGLLGTVTGMIRLFEVITRYGTGDPKLLAGGISEALITTEVGLIIAIPLLLVHNFLRNYKNSIIAELQTGALRLINRLYPKG